MDKRFFSSSQISSFFLGLTKKFPKISPWYLRELTFTLVWSRPWPFWFKFFVSFMYCCGIAQEWYHRFCGESYVLLLIQIKPKSWQEIFHWSWKELSLKQQLLKHDTFLTQTLFGLLGRTACNIVPATCFIFSHAVVRKLAALS